MAGEDRLRVGGGWGWGGLPLVGGRGFVTTPGAEAGVGLRGYWDAG